MCHKAISKQILLLSLAILSTYASLAQGVHGSERAFNLEQLPKREIRAVWLTVLQSLDWPKTYAKSAATISEQKDELIRTLDRYAEANINTVLLQTRVRASSIYPSAYEPWTPSLTGREDGNPGYDPLQFAIEQCHKRGMELHAWTVALPAGDWNSLGCKRLRQRGLKMRKLGAYGYLDPSDEKVVDYIVKVCTEIVEKYDIDGLNFDYLRYPEDWPKPTYKNGDTPNQRRQYLNHLVKEIHDAVKAIKPWVRISCSPIGKYADLPRYSTHNWNARDRVYQDAQYWLRMGWMDQLYPMQYFRGESYYPYVADWMEHSYGNAIASGLGTWFLDPKEGRWTLSDISREMEVSRQWGMGHAHFRSKFLLENHRGIFDFEKQFSPYPALTPTMKQQRVAKVNAPTQLKVTDGVISWQGAAPYYNIYVSDQAPVDIHNPKNLLLPRYAYQSLNTNVQPNILKGWPYVAVTAMDRYGNESAPISNVQSLPAAQPTSSLPSNIYLPNDNQYVDITQAVSALGSMDINYYAIQSLEGNRVRSYLQPIRDKDGTLRLFIGVLPNGVYWVTAHNKRSKKFYRVGSFEMVPSRLAPYRSHTR